MPTWPETVCGQFNAKNAFGAYAGFQGFIAELAKPGVVVQEDLSAEKWRDLWASRCGG